MLVIPLTWTFWLTYMTLSLVRGKDEQHYYVLYVIQLALVWSMELHSVINSRPPRSSLPVQVAFSKAGWLLKGSRTFQADCNCISYVHRSQNWRRRGPRRMHWALWGSVRVCTKHVYLTWFGRIALPSSPVPF